MKSEFSLNCKIETMEDAGYTEMKRIDKKSVYLWNASNDQSEIWVKSYNHLGYAIIIGGVPYQFEGTDPDTRFCDECNRWEQK